MISRPLYLRQLLAGSPTPVLKVVTGMRASGKTTLLALYREALTEQGACADNIVSADFSPRAHDGLRDAESLVHFVTERVRGLKGKLYLLLDGIERVGNWPKAVKSLHKTLDCDITVTGTNTQMLSDLATEVGEIPCTEIRLRPLTFPEFLQFAGAGEPRATEAELFRRFLMFGGLPGIHAFRDDSPKSRYPEDILYAALLRDVVVRHSVRDSDLLLWILRSVAGNAGKPFSVKETSARLRAEGRKLGVQTVYDYLGFLEEACLIERARRRDIKTGKRFKNQERIFAADIGIRYALTGEVPEDDSLLENVVYLALKSAGADVTVGRVGGVDACLVAEKNGRRAYVRVCGVMTAENRDREVTPLLRIRDSYPKLILTLSPLTEGNTEGVETVNLIEFLKNVAAFARFTTSG